MCLLDMRREFQVVVSNFELFCLSVRREIVVSTFYVFYLSRSLSECDKIDHMITCISQNEVGLLDIQTQILTNLQVSDREENVHAIQLDIGIATAELVRIPPLC